MASDIFLKIDGIKGEATDVSHPNEIEVVSWSWGVSKVFISSGGGIVITRPLWQALDGTRGLVT